jgi:RNA-binding protein
LRGDSERLKRLGRVIHVSASRNLVLKAETVPRIGDKVVDENLKTVGSVFDIIGPVSSPYVSVKSTTSEPQRFVKDTLYTIPSVTKRKEKNRYGG